MSPEDLNAFARTHHWGDGALRVLRRIVCKPECTLGTALTVYVHGEPRHYLGQAETSRRPAETEIAAFLRMLRGRINAGSYRHDPDNPCDERDTLLSTLVAPPEELHRAPWLIDANCVAEEIALGRTGDRALTAPPAVRTKTRGWPEILPPEPVRAPRSGLRGVLQRVFAR